MSLAEQLQQLQIPGQASIQQFSSKKVSLLFDVQTAASLDNEAILNIGANGFSELTSIDPIFIRFQDVLFSSKTLQLQRNSLSSKANGKLEQKIREYLFLLSPYVLLKSSQKTLEWLIRRFQVHIHDKDALMSCILPYHETQLFGRIVQLFGKNPSGDFWEWLLPCQKSGSGFNTQTLVKQCIKDRNLLSFISKMADSAQNLLKMNPKSELKLIFSFTARTLAATVEMVQPLSEDMLSYMLPLLHSGFKSGCKDYVCSIYMVTALMSTKVSLQSDVKKALLAAIVKFMEPGWYQEGLLCMLNFITYQNIQNFSPRVFKLFMLLDVPSISTLLCNIQSTYNLDLFLKCIIPSLAEAILKEEGDISSEEFLKILINDFQLSANHVESIIKSLIEPVVSGRVADIEEQEGSVTLLKVLSTRFAAVFDEIMVQYFNKFTKQKNKKASISLKKLTTKCLSSTKHQLIENSDLPLVLSLNHPKVPVRIEAVNQLVATIESEVYEYEQEFFKEAIIARLHDDSSEVINALLKNSKIISKFLPVDTLLEISLKLLKRSDAHFQLNELLIATLQAVNCNPSALFDEFSFVLLAQLFYALSGKRNKKIIEALSSVNVDKGNTFIFGMIKATKTVQMKTMSKKNSNEDAMVKAYMVLLSCIATEIIESTHGLEDFQKFWTFRSNLPINHDLQIISLLLSAQLISQSPSTISLFTKLDLKIFCTGNSTIENQKEFMKILKDSESTDDAKKNLVKMYISNLKSDDDTESDFSVREGFMVFLRCLISIFATALTSSTIVTEEIEKDLENGKQLIFAILSDKSADRSCHHFKCYRYLLNEFFLKTFDSKDLLIRFLFNIYEQLLAEGVKKENTVKASLCALHITRKLISSQDMKQVNQVSLLDLIVGGHLCLLSSPVSMVREVTHDNIKTFYDIISSSKNSTWNYILKKVIDNREEIILDGSFMERFYQNTFNMKSDRRKSDFANLLSGKSKSSKEEERKASLNYLLDVILKCPISIQYSICSDLNLVDMTLLLKHMIVILEANLEKNELSIVETKLASIVLSKLTPESLDTNDDSFKLFNKALSSTNQVIQKSVFNLISAEFYQQVSSAVKYNILEGLLKILVSTESVMVATDIRVILKSLSYEVEHICSLLQQFCNEVDKKKKASRRRTKVVSKPEVDTEEDEDVLKLPLWKSLTELLEILSYRGCVNDPNAVVVSVFEVLDRVLKDNNISLEYIKQLLLSVLINLTEIDTFNLAEDQFKVEILIQCLQSTSELATNQECLRVLGNAAKLYPTRVLHNVMHIFTFMGGTMLRVDNEHSFHVIEKTIDAVIPVLIQQKPDENSRKRASSSTIEEIVVFILQTFVDSAPHCPDHRRLHIFKHLVKVLSTTNYLHTAVILLIKKVIQQQQNRPVIQQDEEMEDVSSPITLEFCKEFFSTYAASVQIHSVYSLVAYLNTIPVEVQKSRAKVSKDLLFDQRTHNDKQTKIFHYTMISFIWDMLQSEKISNVYNCSTTKQKAITSTILNLLEDLFGYAEKVGKFIDAASQDHSSKFWQGLLQKTYDLIGQVHKFLPFDPFITVVSGLLIKENHLTRKKSLELLSTKLGDHVEFTEQQEKQLLQLCSVIIERVEHHSDGETPMNLQLMMYTIKLLALKLCEKHNEEFITMLPVIAEIFTSTKTNQMVAINAILCAAELCKHLRSTVLPYLPLLIKPILQKITLGNEVSSKKNLLLFSSCITALQSILKGVPLFLSPYLSDMLHTIAICEFASSSITDHTLTNKITIIKEDLGRLIPARVLLPTIKDCYAKCLDDRILLPTIVDIYRISFQHISKSDANSNFNTTICDIFRNVFDLRNVSSAEDDTVLISKVESITIQAFCDLVMKLSENTLRPMYLQLFNWSTNNDKISPRLLTFYRLSVALSERLKSLFLLFVGHTVKKSTEILKIINIDSKELEEYDGTMLKELVGCVLDTLSNCFHYDAQGFVNKERFESIMQYLVDQLDNQLHYSQEEYKCFVQNHLLPCMVNFAAAVNDSACWKPLNHQILLKTKSSLPQVRLAALQVVGEIYNRMGESFMILVPETIPFLAEILEDDSIEVEKQCQLVIKQIENITGESLQKYF